MNRPLAVALLVVATLTGSAIQAQDLIPPNIAEDLGLIESWSRPIASPAGAQSIVDQQLFVHEKDPDEFIEVTLSTGKPATAKPAAAKPATAKAADANGAPADSAAESADAAQGKVLVRISTNRVGAGGKVLGTEEAQRLADNEIRRLKRRGIEATTSTRSVPRVRLYSISNDGTLECRDAETGKPVWMVRIGDRRLPYGAIGVNEEYLSITNGANLIQLEASTGEVLEQVRTLGAPVWGAINSGNYAMVPTIGGGVEGYPLSDPTRDPFREHVAGNTLALPTKAPGSTKIAWGTDRGFVYVMEMQGNPSVEFRLNTDGIVSGRIASATDDRFFFGSESGQVYGLQATRSGRVLWSVPFGEPFYNEPIIAGDQVLLRSTYGNLYSLSIDSGIMKWEAPTSNVADLLGAFGDHIFVTTLTGSMAVIDGESGKRVGAYNEVRPDRLLVNKLTNRLYLVSESGDVQCLRPIESELPVFNIQPKMEEVAEVEEKPKAKVPTSPFDAGGGDPFGAGGGDPFGAGGGDPFGGGAMDDPFGGGDAGGDAMADPFGGNPFGE